MIHVGIGYDVHALVEGRKLILGGVDIAHPKGLDGHSDADVLMHAICDAILGAIGLGDIGTFFPNTDPRWKNAPSKVFLQEAARHVSFHNGKIVNVGGTFGMRGRAGRMAYSASKWGLRGITKSFALEVGQYNINVNYVAPGMVDGPRFREKVCADMAKKLNITVEEAAQRHAAEYALPRVTTDHDVANACLFFASDVSRQITGADIPVDGGWAAL